MVDLFPNDKPDLKAKCKTGKKGKSHTFPTLDEAVEHVRQSAGKALHHDLVAAGIYTYCDADGNELFAVARYEPEPRDGTKTCRPFHAAEGGWRVGDPEGGLLPLYRLVAVKSGKGRVYVVEGEGCADVGCGIGLVCTTSAHGAKSAAKTDWSPLAGHEVVILPDKDEPGNEFAEDAARILTALNPPATVKVVKLPDLAEPGADIVDYLELYKDKPAEDVRALIEALADAAPVWADAAPLAEILDAAPETIDRPLRIIGGYAYLVTWVHVRSGNEESVKLVVLRSDGKCFADGSVPGALPLSDLGLKVKMQTIPHLDTMLSGAALKRYAAGNRPNPADVFDRVRRIVAHFMDFSHSFGSPADLADMVALYIMAGYMLDAFSVIGYLWPNADKGSGKTKLLVVVTSLGCMGVLVTVGGTFASLRDLADYGAVIGFDDAENIMDAKRVDPEKRTLLLAGNRKGSYVTLKEPWGDGWTTRYIHAFCPRLFSAINLPDETLGSRTIIVPLLRSADAEKANRDPADPECWPVDRRPLVDDLWLIGLANLPKLPTYDRKAAGLVPLSGRVLEPWRAILATALWLQSEHGVEGAFDRMSALAVRYQSERSDIEEASPVRVLIMALFRLLDAGNGDAAEVTPSQVSDAMNALAREDEIDHPGDSFTNAKKAGRMLQRLRFERAQRTAGSRRWRVARGDLAALSRAYGMVVAGAPTVECRNDVSAVDDVSRETPPADSVNGTTAETDTAECRCDVSADDEVARETPPPQQQTATPANSLQWED